MELNKIQKLHYLILTRHPKSSSTIHAPRWKHYDWGLDIAMGQELFHVSWHVDGDFEVHNATGLHDGCINELYNIIDDIKYNHED